MTVEGASYIARSVKQPPPADKSAASGHMHTVNISPLIITTGNLSIQLILSSLRLSSSFQSAEEGDLIPNSLLEQCP